MWNFLLISLPFGSWICKYSEINGLLYKGGATWGSNVSCNILQFCCKSSYVRNCLVWHTNSLQSCSNCLFMIIFVRTTNIIVHHTFYQWLQQPFWDNSCNLMSLNDLNCYDTQYNIVVHHTSISCHLLAPFAKSFISHSNAIKLSLSFSFFLQTCKEFWLVW